VFKSFGFMVAVVKRIFISFSLIVISSCYDRYFGPTLQNEVGTVISVEVTYADGVIERSKWRPCMAVLVGRSDEALHAITNIKVSNKSGSVFYQISEKEVKKMLDKEQKNSNRYSMWVIGKEKLWFSDKAETEICKEGREKKTDNENKWE
jgi:hypothetical protein